MPTTNPTTWSDESLATFKEKSSFRMDEFLERHDLQGCDRRLIFIDYGIEDEWIVRWMPNATMNDKARVFCREYLKSYPTNPFAIGIHQLVSTSDFDIAPGFLTLTDLINYVRKFED